VDKAYNKNIMKYRDTSEARKLLSACGEYGQLAGEVGKGDGHKDALKGGKGGCRALSESSIAPGVAADPSK